jgi:hypothetical protein
VQKDSDHRNPLVTGIDHERGQHTLLVPGVRQSKFVENFPTIADLDQLGLTFPPVAASCHIEIHWLGLQYGQTGRADNKLLLGHLPKSAAVETQPDEKLLDDDNQLTD